MQENLDQGNRYCKSIERKIWWSLRCIFLIDQGRQVKSIFVMFVFNHYKIVVKQKKKPQDSLKMHEQWSFCGIFTTLHCWHFYEGSRSRIAWPAPLIAAMDLL